MLHGSDEYPQGQPLRKAGAGQTEALEGRHLAGRALGIDTGVVMPLMPHH